MLANEATYTISEGDFVAAQQLHFRRALTRRPYQNLVFFAIILAGFSILLDGAISLQGMVMALLVVVSGAALLWWIIPMNARRTYNQRKIWDELHLRWDASSLIIKSERGDGSFSWNEFYRWAADKRVLLLYVDSRVFYMLPLRAFPAEASNDIVGALKSAGIQGE